MVANGVKKSRKRMIDIIFLLTISRGLKVLKIIKTYKSTLITIFACFQFIGSTSQLREEGRSWIFDRKNRRPLMRPAVETDRKTLHNGRKPSIIPDVVIQEDQ
jgi:hypothetical protein